MGDRACGAIGRSGLVAMIIGLLVVLLLRLAMAEVPTEFLNAQSFYHDLSSERQQQLLHHSDLNDEAVTMAVEGLLTNREFNIQQSYNKGCHLITEKRARQILHMARVRDAIFEDRFLGMACLSENIIRARDAHGRWPPERIPLFVNGLSFKDLNTEQIGDFMMAALKQAPCWYSMEWISTVDWDRMEVDLSPLITIDIARYLREDQRQKFVSYLMRINAQRTDLEVRQKVERFFMKAIRMIPFLRQEVEPKAFASYIQRWRRDGSEEMRASKWCNHLLNILDNFGSERFEGPLLEAILDSKVFDVDFWRISTNEVTAVNNVLELLILTIKLDNAGERHRLIERRLDIFFENVSLALIMPIKMRLLVRELWRGSYERITERHSRRWMNNGRLFYLLHDLLPSNPPKQLMALRMRLKSMIGPLQDEFMNVRPNGLSNMSSHTRRLYEGWLKEGENWPGIAMAHEQVRHEIERVFELFHQESGDPRLGGAYPLEDWRLAFSCISFEVRYGIPRAFVPSRCFLEVLLHFHRKGGHIRWGKLRRRLKEGCSLPIDKEGQERYLRVLEVATGELSWLLDLLPWTTGRALYGALCGDGQKGLDSAIERILATLSLSNLCASCICAC